MSTSKEVGSCSNSGSSPYPGADAGPEGSGADGCEGMATGSFEVVSSPYLPEVSVTWRGGQTTFVIATHRSAKRSSSSMSGSVILVISEEVGMHEEYYQIQRLIERSVMRSSPGASGIIVRRCSARDLSGRRCNQGSRRWRSRMI